MHLASTTCILSNEILNKLDNGPVHQKVSVEPCESITAFQMNVLPTLRQSNLNLYLSLLIMLFSYLPLHVKLSSVCELVRFIFCPLFYLVAACFSILYSLSTSRIIKYVGMYAPRSINPLSPQMGFKHYPSPILIFTPGWRPECIPSKTPPPPHIKDACTYSCYKPSPRVNMNMEKKCIQALREVFLSDKTKRRPGLELSSSKTQDLNTGSTMLGHMFLTTGLAIMSRSIRNNIYPPHLRAFEHFLCLGSWEFDLKDHPGGEFDFAWVGWGI